MPPPRRWHGRCRRRGRDTPFSVKTAAAASTSALRLRADRDGRSLVLPWCSPRPTDGQSVDHVSQGASISHPSGLHGAGLFGGEGARRRAGGAGAVSRRCRRDRAGKMIDATRPSGAADYDGAVRSGDDNDVGHGRDVPVTGPAQPRALDLPTAVGAVAMSVSTIIVAANVQLLRRGAYRVAIRGLLRLVLRPAHRRRAPGEPGVQARDRSSAHWSLLDDLRPRTTRISPPCGCFETGCQMSTVIHCRGADAPSPRRSGSTAMLGGIEGRRRLVEDEQQRRLTHHRPAKGELLPLPA